ncbi:MAG: phosphoglucosamine mutase, partial [Eggerthella sp.]|nr:phosphoglucosamine mutase [Eggerthella sp.]
LLCETMAQRGMSLGQLVDDMFQKVGKLEFERQGLTITDEQMANFRAEIVPNYAPAEICGKRVVDVDRRDGVKFYLEGDAWVMMRPSGTEPLVRIYAEAETVDEVHDLLKAAESAVVS